MRDTAAFPVYRERKTPFCPKDGNYEQTNLLRARINVNDQLAVYDRAAERSSRILMMRKVQAA